MASTDNAAEDARLTFAEEAIRKADERATSGLLAIEMIHEIKNPLEAVGHLTYLTLQEADNPDSVRRYMQMAAEQMTLLRQITGETLGFARPYSLRSRPGAPCWLRLPCAFTSARFNPKKSTC